MQTQTYNAIYDALKTICSLPASAIQPGIPQPHWIYKRNPAGNWQGTLQQISNPFPIIPRDQHVLKRVQAIQTALEVEHPDYLKSVWLANFSMPVRPNDLLRNLLSHALDTYKTLQLTDAQINSIALAAVHFFDSPTVPWRMFAPLVGLNGPLKTPLLTFPNSVQLRPISDAEYTHLYGSLIPLSGARQLVMPNLALVVDIDMPKHFGIPRPEALANPFADGQEAIDHALLTIISFKNLRAIAYDGIFCYPASLCLIPTGLLHTGSLDLTYPGANNLTDQEIDDLQTHTNSFAKIDRHLNVAAHRLVDATKRRRDDEAVIDAVVGLESILLYKTTQELAFKFGLNYSALPFISNRFKAFDFAKSLYELRSRIVHGTPLKEGTAFGREKLSLSQMALRAQEALRKTFCYFVRSDDPAAFTTKDYWERRHLVSLPDQLMDSDNDPQI